MRRSAAWIFETRKKHVWSERSTHLIGAHQFDNFCSCGWQTAVCDLPSKWV